VKLRRVFASAFLALILLATPAGVTPRLLAQASVTSGQRSTPAAQEPQKAQQEEDEDAAYRHSSAVQWLGSKLGLQVDQAATLFEVLNFLILIGVLGYALVKILPKTFRNRSTAIQKNLVEARTATEEARARLTSVEARLSKLDGQIAAMQEQAEKDVVAEEARARAAIEEEKRKILASAEQEITAATVNAQRQLQKYAAELAIDQAARKLVVTAETDRLLVQAFAQRLSETKGGEN
jgi:F-type H+-transporting ATPase subunit b